MLVCILSNGLFLIFDRIPLLLGRHAHVLSSGCANAGRDGKGWTHFALGVERGVWELEGDSLPINDPR